LSTSLTSYGGDRVMLLSDDRSSKPAGVHSPGSFGPGASLEAEILVLRHQLNVLSRNPDPRQLRSWQRA